VRFKRELHRRYLLTIIPGISGRARRYLPDIQRTDRITLSGLLEGPPVRRKDHANLFPLTQYKFLDTRAHNLTAASDPATFPPKGGIRISIDYDVERPILRAIELINRTNHDGTVKWAIANWGSRSPQ
jgi:hypothetical protein